MAKNTKNTKNTKVEWKPGNSPGFHLNLVSRLLTRFADRRLAELGANVAYLPVLGALKAAAPKSQRELAEAGQIGQPAMAQMLERMVKEGLLLRTADPSDGRKAQFSLTDHASGQMAHIQATLAEGNRDVFTVLTESELDEFLVSLKKIELRLKALMP